MNKQREALELALEWIDAQPEPRMIGAQKALQAIREALAEPEQEPVEWECKTGGLRQLTQRQYDAQTDRTKCHYTRTAPPARKPLTDAERYLDRGDS